MEKKKLKVKKNNFIESYLYNQSSVLEQKFSSELKFIVPWVLLEQYELVNNKNLLGNSKY